MKTDGNWIDLNRIESESESNRNRIEIVSKSYGNESNKEQASKWDEMRWDEITPDVELQMGWDGMGCDAATTGLDAITNTMLSHNESERIAMRTVL